MSIQLFRPRWAPSRFRFYLLLTLVYRSEAGMFLLARRWEEYGLSLAPLTASWADPLNLTKFWPALAWPIHKSRDLSMARWDAPAEMREITAPPLLPICCSCYLAIWPSLNREHGSDSPASHHKHCGHEG